MHANSADRRRGSPPAPNWGRGRMSSITRMSIAVAVVAAAALAGPAPAAASPDLGATPTAISFADHGIHDGNHENRTVDFEATGATQISSVAIVGADPGQFRVSADRGCTNATLNPGDRCGVDVQFIPSSVGAKTAELLVTDTSGDTEVLLSGTGITGQLASNPPAIQFNPQPYYFGQQGQGLNLFNPSTTAATQAIAGTITGPDAARFFVNYWGQLLHAALLPRQWMRARRDLQPHRSRHLHRPTRDQLRRHQRDTDRPAERRRTRRRTDRHRAGTDRLRHRRRGPGRDADRAADQHRGLPGASPTGAVRHRSP